MRFHEFVLIPITQMYLTTLLCNNRASAVDTTMCGNQDDCSKTLGYNTNYPSTVKEQEEEDDDDDDDDDGDGDGDDDDRSNDRLYDVPWDDEDIGWEDYFYMNGKEMSDLFDCDTKYNENEKRIPDQNTLMNLRLVFNSIVGPKHSSLSFPSSSDSGFHVPVEVKHTKNGIERGVFATQSLKRGDLIWTPKQTGILSKIEFNRYIASIPPEERCDLIEASYEATPENWIAIDLDESYLMRDVDNDESENKEDEEEVDENDNDYSSNIGCISELAEWMPGGCHMNLFALRDIDAGEELIQNLSEDFGATDDSGDERFCHLNDNLGREFDRQKFLKDNNLNEEVPWDNTEITWEDFFWSDENEIYELYQCHTRQVEQSLVPDHSSWRILHNVYKTVIGATTDITDESSNANLYSTVPGIKSHKIISNVSVTDTGSSSFFVPIEVKITEGKGRGVFAIEPVKKGDLILVTKSLIKFRSGKDLRRFLAAIPVEFVCDVMDWMYVEFHDEKSTANIVPEPCIALDLDESSLMNSASFGSQKKEVEENVGCSYSTISEAEWIPGGCHTNAFALRDIEAGEELLLEYADFAISYGWEWFGL